MLTELNYIYEQLSPEYTGSTPDTQSPVRGQAVSEEPPVVCQPFLKHLRPDPESTICGLLNIQARLCGGRGGEEMTIHQWNTNSVMSVGLCNDLLSLKEIDLAIHDA